MKKETLEHLALIGCLAKASNLLLSEWVAGMVEESDKVQVMHAMVGIGGEVGELIYAIDTRDKANVLEEVGDLVFFCRLLRIATQCGTGRQESAEVENYTVTSQNVLINLPLHSARVIDTAKRFAIYNQPLNGARLRESLDQFEETLAKALALFGYRYEQAVSHNYEKLSKRYEGGTYSDKAAQERADKPGEE